jgi:streptogramin lyase
MKTKPVSILFFSILIALAAAFTLLFSANQSSIQASAPESQSTSPFITEFPLPNQGAPRYLIQVGGDFWFTAPGVNAIGRLIVTDTLDFDYTFYTIPTANSDPYQLVSDGSNIWFTQRAGNKIGKLEMATGLFTQYDILTSNSAPTGITRAPNGTLWFVQRSGNKLASLNPGNGAITEFPYPTANALLQDVAAAPNGQGVWLTSPGLRRLSYFEFSSQTYTDTPTSDPLFGIFTPNQVAVDASSVPWASSTNGWVGRYLATTLTFFRWYQVAPQSANLGDLLLFSGGGNTTTWFTDATSGYVGYIQTSASSGNIVSLWRHPLSNRAPVGIQVDANQSIWLADSQNHMIIKWDAPYVFNNYLPVVVKP